MPSSSSREPQPLPPSAEDDDADSASAVAHPHGGGLEIIDDDGSAPAHRSRYTEYDISPPPGPDQGSPTPLPDGLARGAVEIIEDDVDTPGLDSDSDNSKKERGTYPLEALPDSTAPVPYTGILEGDIDQLRKMKAESQTGRLSTAGSRGRISHVPSRDADANADEENQPSASSSSTIPAPPNITNIAATQSISPPTTSNRNAAPSGATNLPYPLLEATLVSESQSRLREPQQPQAQPHSRQPSAPVIEAELIIPFWRRNLVKIIAGVLLIIALIAAAATAGAMIGQPDNNVADPKRVDALDEAQSEVSSTRPTQSVEPSSSPTESSPGASLIAASPPPTTSRPSGSPVVLPPSTSPTLTDTPSSYPTIASTMSPTRCPTTSLGLDQSRPPESPILPGMCVAFRGALFQDAPTFLFDAVDDECDKDCTPDVAIHGDNVIIARGESSLHYLLSSDLLDQGGPARGTAIFDTGGGKMDGIYDVATSEKLTVVGIPKTNTVHTFVKNVTTGSWDHSKDAVLLLSSLYGNETHGLFKLAKFGTSLSIDDDILVVGAPSSVEDESTTVPPAAYIFRWNGTNWKPEAKLTPSVQSIVESSSAQRGGSSDNNHESPLQIFGNSVYAKGNTVAIADSRHGVRGNKGAVFVYEYEPETKSWREIGAIENVDCIRHFGTSIAITHDDGLLISCPRKHSWSGVVYFYTRTGPGCSYAQQQMIAASDTQSKEYFGYMDEIAVHGDGMVIGSSRKNGGKAYFFARDNDRWTEVAQIQAPHGAEYFGYEVALSSKSLVVNTQKNAYSYLIGDCRGAQSLEQMPTSQPTMAPSIQTPPPTSTAQPSIAPSMPTPVPTSTPTLAPSTKSPTPKPSSAPTESPSTRPMTDTPTSSVWATKKPTYAPTLRPTTSKPTNKPYATVRPTRKPTFAPTSLLFFTKYEGQGCRTSKGGTGSDGKEFEFLHDKSLSECKNVCLSSQQCYGWEHHYYDGYHCEVWKVPIDISRLELVDKVDCYVINDETVDVGNTGDSNNGAEPVTFEEFEDRGCRTKDGEKGSSSTGEYLKFEGVSRDECMLKCLRADRCFGFEHHSDDDDCEIWQVPIDEQELEKVKDHYCYLPPSPIFN